MSALVSEEIKFFVDRSRRGPAKAGGLGRRTLGLEADRLAANVPDSPAATAQQFAASQ
jgi:hypothetical protein